MILDALILVTFGALIAIGVWLLTMSAAEAWRDWKRRAP